MGAAHQIYGIKMKKYWILFLALGTFSQLHALEVQPGDYEMLPANKSFVLVYYTNTSSEKYYTDGHEVYNNADFDTQVGLFRYIYAYQLKENIRLQPQVILPMAHLDASGDVASFGKKSDFGDLIIGMPIVFTTELSEKSVFTVAPFITLPTGAYDKNDALNVGENRWNLILQTAWLYHINSKLTLENVFDTTFYTKNDNYTASSYDLKQDPRYEYQLYLRYNLSSITTFGIGGGWVGGAENKVNEIKQNDQLESYYAKISATHFFTPKFQANISWGQDLKVKQGFKQDSDFTLRLGYLF